MAGFKAFAGVVGAALLAAACSSNNSDKEFCAINGDGALMSTADGKNFSHLNDEQGDNNPDIAAWVEGKAGFGGGPICTTTDAERSMPLKDMPANAVELPREPRFDM